MTDGPIAQVAINTIRTLAIDATQQANSGHLVTPMGMAPVVYCLWHRFLGFDPEDPIWPNRDRFVLSAGHESMLLYSMLDLTGVKAVDPDYEIVGKPSVSLDDLKTFRQLGSRWPATRNIGGRQALRPQRVPWDKLLLRALAWRSRTSGWPPGTTALASPSLPPTCMRSAGSVEEGSTFGWERYVGENGESLGMHFPCASASLKSLQKKFGFTPEHVLEAAKVQLRRAR